MALADVVTTGVRVDALRALRDRLATDLDGCESARDVSSLSQRLMDVLSQIEALENAAPKRKATALDELAKRRKTGGRPDSPVQSRAKRATK